MEKPKTFDTIDDVARDIIAQRAELWASIIKDAEIENRTKEDIKKCIDAFITKAEQNPFRTADDCYTAISSILSYTEKDSHTQEAANLFENLRDDIWALHKELDDS